MSGAYTNLNPGLFVTLFVKSLYLLAIALRENGYRYRHETLTIIGPVNRSGMMLLNSPGGNTLQWVRFVCLAPPVVIVTYLIGQPISDYVVCHMAS